MPITVASASVAKQPLVFSAYLQPSSVNQRCTAAVDRTGFRCTGDGRLLAEVNAGTLNLTFTEAQAVAQHPMFHITPTAGWMNDPNGMFQLGALTHVFFQWNPAAGVLVLLCNDPAAAGSSALQLSACNLSDCNSCMDYKYWHQMCLLKVPELCPSLVQYAQSVILCSRTVPPTVIKQLPNCCLLSVEPEL